MTLLIMAAGNGSRYGALKQFDHLGPNKEFLFEFSIFDAIRNGFDHIVIITKQEFVVEIKTYLEGRLPNEVKIDVLAQSVTDLPEGFSDKKIEREKPWGTGHAVWTARNHIKGGFVVLNADDFYGENAFNKAANLMYKNEKSQDYGIVAYALKDTLSDFGSVSRGICQTENGLLTNIKEMVQIERTNQGIVDADTDTQLTGEEPASMNFWVCYPSIFKEIEKQFIAFLNNEVNILKGELYIPFIIQKMMEDHGVDVQLSSAKSLWFGVTYAEDKKIALKTLKDLTSNKTYPSPLWKN